MAVFTEFLWIAVIGTITGFVYAFGIGANDVANSFASTIASKSLTLKQAVIVAAIFEFAGALLLGASVTSTIRNKIFDVKLYDDEPEIVMLGMMTSLMTAAFMLLGATHYGLPVSTTHTIVGCIMGFSIAAKGFDSIDWSVAQKIFISWAASPLVSGAVGFAFFGTVRILVLRHDDALRRSNLFFPVVLMVGIGIDAFYILYKGFNNLSFAEDLKLEVVLPASFGAGAVCAGIWLVFLGPIAMRRIRVKREEREADPFDEEKPPAKQVYDAGVPLADDDEEDDEVEYGDDGVMVSEPQIRKPARMPVAEQPVKEVAPPADQEVVQSAGGRSFLSRASQSFVDNTYGQDLHSQSMHENAKAAQLWDDAEVFDEDAEQLFTYVQVFTACLNSFAHGANDVSNAIAPISAIIYIYQESALKSKSPVQKWILAYGGAGIVLGLLLYGYKIMKSLGFKVTALSPSRGACAELASSLFVVTASFLQIPVSSTQCITGAVTGVGLASGLNSIHWLFLLRVCMGWVIVFFVSVILSAGLFSFCAFSPSLV